MQKFKSSQTILHLLDIETDVGWLEEAEDTTEISAFQDTYLERCHTHVYYRVLQSQAGNNIKGTHISLNTKRI